MIQNLYYNSPEFRTLGDFLEQEGLSPAFAYRQRPKDFLDIVDNTGRTNLFKIVDSYINQEDKNDVVSKYNSGLYNAIELNAPTLFSIDSKDAILDLYSVQGNLSQPTIDVNYFISKKLVELMNNPEYALRSQNRSMGDVKATFPKVSVWLWSRSLSSSFIGTTRGIASSYELFNLSMFVDQLSTISNKEGSSFSFSLPPIKGSYANDVEGWKMRLSSFKQYGDSRNKQYSAVSSVEDKNMIIGDFFFHNIIQQNDLVFISYEDLPSETKEYRSELSVPFSAIRGKIWDMIGFVDKNSINVSKQNKNEVNINITGRDLTKLIIEDGTYFWATEFGLLGTTRFAGNRDNRILRRINAGPEGMATYFNIANKSIEYIMKFVISQLANTGIVPTEIFNSYGDDRSTIFIRKEDGEERTTNVEEIGNNNFEIRIKRNKKYRSQEVLAEGVWSITKVIVDPQVANLRLIDTTLLSEQGSLINFVNRVCQDPFVEFYTETIKDQFYWIARRPPHNQQAILDAIDGISLGVTTEQEEIFVEVDGILTRKKFDVSTANATASFVIDVDPLDVVSFELEFHTTVYSWYKLESRYAFGGSTDNVSSYALLPAVFLPTYTNLFGSRPYNCFTNYVNYVPTSGKEDVRNYKNALEQAYYDLKWLIETNSYLPFTRRGSITINENRRIKKGMHIRLNSTGEIFLVTSVSHSISISGGMARATTLQVERGMIERYIKGEDVEGFGFVSYFNIVDMPINLKRRRAQKELTSITKDGKLEQALPYEIIANWRENEDVINFFVNRRQFKYDR
jgi:hypothetical protein